MEDFQRNTAFAQYTTFTVANATDKYRLLVAGYSGTAGDAMSSNSRDSSLRQKIMTMIEKVLIIVHHYHDLKDHGGTGVVPIPI